MKQFLNHLVSSPAIALAPSKQVQGDRLQLGRPP
jgi:hypothetical protein